METITVAVADLTRFCYRSGDIDHRFSPSPTSAEGIAGHQRLYTRRPNTYVPEFTVEWSQQRAEIELIVRGRADGYDPKQAIVEEIKTCRVAPEKIPESVSRQHMAQGRLYAAIIAAQENLEFLDVQLTWLNIDSDTELQLQQRYSAQELSQFLETTLSRFSNWLATIYQLRTRRNTSITNMAFPYGEFRAGQREIAELAYKCIDQGGELLLEAPTGMGKTAALLFPALKALAQDKHDKIAFVTAKTIGRRAAENTLADFRSGGYLGTNLTLSAKDAVCLSPGKACHPDDCPYARGYYDKLPAALDTAINETSLDRSSIESIAQRFEVCPYELAKDLLPWVDVIIADQHYVYSLNATISTMMEANDKRWSLLVDEAHNLPDRARGMYGAALEKKKLMAAKKEANGAIAKALSNVNRRFLDLQNRQWQAPDFHSENIAPEKLERALRDFSAGFSQAMATQPTFGQQFPSAMQFYFETLQFLRVLEQWGPEYRFHLTRSSDAQSLVVSLRCLDPSRLLQLKQKKAHASLAFSATLTPLPWTRKTLGLSAEAVCSRAQSPFAAQQLKVTLATHIDTRYQQRATTLPALADTIRQWLENTPGNCILYFPSYQYLNDCLALLELAQLSRTVVIQSREFDEAARQQLVEQLQQRKDIAAFCILGGVFGEGIDLPGQQLTSVVVVGLGMPQVNRYTRELQQWYQEQAQAGFEFTFLYPGMQKVDQALGRVVRRLNDHGSALLIDSRYTQKQYTALLPPWWDYQRWSEPE